LWDNDAVIMTKMMAKPLKIKAVHDLKRNNLNEFVENQLIFNLVLKSSLPGQVIRFIMFLG